MFEAELEYERLLRKQELLKREKEHKKELQSVREEIETEKQKLPKVQEVQLSHTNMYPTYHICMGTLALSQMIYRNKSLKMTARVWKHFPYKPSVM